MKTKEIYSRPEIEIITIISEGIIATSGEETFNLDSSHGGGDAGAKRRNFWD